jgi:hypothetical protein
MGRRGYISAFLGTEAGEVLFKLLILGLFLWVMFKCALIAWRAFSGHADDENLPNWVRVAEQTEHMSYRWTYENSAKGKRDTRRQQAGGGRFEEAPEVDAYPEDEELAAHLAVLGLRPPVTFAEIKAHYRQLVLKNHPDVLKRSDGAVPDDRMAEINRAYEWLENRYAAKF